MPRPLRLVLVEVAVLAGIAVEAWPLAPLDEPVFVLSVLALVVALPLRLVLPEVALVVGSLGGIWFSLIGPAVLMGRLAYRRRPGWVVLAWLAVGVTIAVRPHWITGTSAVQVNVTTVATMVAVYGAGAAIGRLRRSREAQREAFRSLQSSLEVQRGLAVDAARAEERATMAREMHDVVSHQISLIALQAGALRSAATSPDVTDAAETIRRLSVRANLELRQLLHALRTAQTAGPASMPHTLDQVDELWAASGLPGDLEVLGDAEEVPPLVQSACYRVVQEGLSNAAKHAPGAAVSVRCAVLPDTVTVSVRTTAPRGAPAADLSNGLGLLGLRERVSVLGGTLSAGPRPGGGYGLHATLPLLGGRLRTTPARDLTTG